MHPALFAAFLYVAVAFLLLSLFPILLTIGNSLWGAQGAFLGGVAAYYILLWVVCWL
jgi:hypothetical protein